MSPPRFGPTALLLGLLTLGCDTNPASAGEAEGSSGTGGTDAATTATTGVTEPTDPSATQPTDPSATSGSETDSTTLDPTDAATSDPSDTAGPAMDCGNAIAEGNEECDGDDLRDWECGQFGFMEGTLHCNNICQLEFDGCQAFSCGDGEVEREEICDGDNLAEQTCATLGFDNGALACDDDCFGFNTAGCGTCGDGTVDQAETCDSAALGGETCLTLGFDGGVLGCGADCQAYDTSGCTTCGDGNVAGTESCDGANLDGENCSSLGYDAGSLGCDDGCGFDDSGCFDNTNCCFANGSPGCEEGAVQACVCALDSYCCNVTWDGQCVQEAVDDCGAQCSLCGNNNLEDGEVCDNNQFGGATCTTMGFDNGGLSCTNECGTISTANCGDCGDGSIDPAEDCDGGNLGGQSCASQGFDGGTLSCAGNCLSFNTSNCISIPSWSGEVHPIFTANCGCHGSGFAPWAGNPNAAAAYAAIVNVSAGGGLLWIDAGDADNSYIVDRIEGTGGFMPPAPSMPLSAAQVATIREWIDAGAPQN